jgi:hypothetical protein
MDLILGAQSSASTVLERLSARQIAARDLVFWAAAIAIPLLFVGQVDIKLGLIGITLAGFALESALGLCALRGAAALRAAWAVRGLALLGAAAFAGWRLHEAGRAHRELVAEVRALREAMRQVKLGMWRRGSRRGGLGKQCRVLRF